MKITKITIIPESRECERKDVERIRALLIRHFTGKVFFETSGEIVADCIIEREMKELKKFKKTESEKNLEKQFEQLKQKYL